MTNRRDDTGASPIVCTTAESGVSSQVEGAATGMVAPGQPIRVRIEHPLALFVPERMLVSTVPLPLYLLELVPGSVKSDYERSASGLVANEADRIRRRTLRYPGGLRVQVEVHGDQVRGLPTTFDYDYFLALCRIADEGGVDSQGYFIDPGYRAILRAAGRSDDAIGGEQVEAVKRALARFGGLMLHTKLDVDFGERSSLVRAGSRHPLVPDGAPPVREREGKHWVLEYDIEAERRRDAAFNSIERLRINPLWLDQATAGIAAWMDISLHNSLRSAYAKRLLQLFTIRAARGWRPLEPWVVGLAELYDLLEVPLPLRSKAQTRTSITKALETLAHSGVLGDYALTKLARGEYEVRVSTGSRLLAASHQRGSGSSDSIADRMLLWHLRSLGFSAQQARELVRSKPEQVRTVLRRVHYLIAYKGGMASGRPIEDWAAWTRAAIEGEYAFADPEWQRWLTLQLEAGARGEWLPNQLAQPALVQEPPTPRVLVTPRPSEDSPSPAGAEHEPHPSHEERRATLTFADDIWGQALEAFVAADPEHARVYDAWLSSTALEQVTETEVMVVAPSSFQAEWITKKYLDPLTAFVTTVAGRPLGLVVRPLSTGDAGSAASLTQTQPDLFSDDR